MHKEMDAVYTQGAAMHKEMDAVNTRIDDVEKYVSKQDVNSDFTQELRKIDTSFDILEGTMESKFSTLERRINAIETTMGQEGLGEGSAVEHKHAMEGDMATNAIEPYAIETVEQEQALYSPKRY